MATRLSGPKCYHRVQQHERGLDRGLVDRRRFLPTHRFRLTLNFDRFLWRNEGWARDDRAAASAVRRGGEAQVVKETAELAVVVRGDLEEGRVVESGRVALGE